MAVGKGSILRASNAGIKQEPAGEAEELSAGAGYLHSAGAVIKVPVGSLQIMDESEDTRAEVISVLEESIRKYGLLEPLLVWNKGEEKFPVLDGNKRIEAARNIGLDMLPVLTADGIEEAQAWEIYRELHRYSVEKEAIRDYEVVSSIRSDIPVYLL